jgi:hypothetical protein
MERLGARGRRPGTPEIRPKDLWLLLPVSSYDSSTWSLLARPATANQQTQADIDAWTSSVEQVNELSAWRYF